MEGGGIVISANLSGEIRLSSSKKTLVKRRSILYNGKNHGRRSGNETEVSQRNDADVSPYNDADICQNCPCSHDFLC